MKMEGCANKDVKACPELLDLISKDRDSVLHKEEMQRGYGSSEDKQLELRLGPPGEGDWGFKKSNFKGTNESSLSLTHNKSTTRRGFGETWMMKNNNETQPCSSKVLDLHSAQKKGLSPSSANTAVFKRNTPAAVIGWPPVRSFRKNLAGSNLVKPAPPETKKLGENEIACDKPVESYRCSSSFVKINMDGVPIGRKVSLKAYDSYEKLSSAVDELFRDLLTARRDSLAGGIDNKHEGERTIIGSGDYALVYEDNEGDRVLVGDVPWNMFVSTVKRLRVVKSNEISTLRLSKKQEKSASSWCCPKN